MLDRAIYGYKTKAAAIKNAEKLNAEYKALGCPDIWEATQELNGKWIVTKTETRKFVSDHIQIIKVGF